MIKAFSDSVFRTIDTVKANNAALTAFKATATPAAKATAVADQTAVLNGRLATPVSDFVHINWGAIIGATQTYDGPPVLGDYQRQRAQQKLDEMPFFERPIVDIALARAASPEERDYILKAIAAGHGAFEVAQFADQIRGKGHDWMHHNLRLVDDSVNGGKGIQQQWNDSCGPTTAEALHGEMDPIYSLNVRQGNRDITSVDAHTHIKIFGMDLDLDLGGNGGIANEQRADLERNGGTAVDRGDKGGNGMVLETAIDELKDTTGIDYVDHNIAGGGLLAPVLRSAAFAKMDTDLARGIPCALRINNGAGSTGAHMVLVTGIIDGPPKKYAIHDPWEGKTVYVKADDLRAGNVVPSIAGWSKVSDVYTS